MSDEDSGITWPSAFVAGMIVLFLTGVVVTAIVRYPVDDALRIWTGMASIAGVIAGAFVTYFFTRESVAAARNAAAAERERAETAIRALTALAGFIDQGMWYRLLRKVPEVGRAVTGQL